MRWEGLTIGGCACCGRNEDWRSSVQENISKPDCRLALLRLLLAPNKRVLASFMVREVQPNSKRGEVWTLHMADVTFQNLYASTSAWRNNATKVSTWNPGTVVDNASRPTLSLMCK